MFHHRMASAFSHPKTGAQGVNVAGTREMKRVDVWGQNLEGLEIKIREGPTAESCQNMLSLTLFHRLVLTLRLSIQDGSGVYRPGRIRLS